MEINRVISRKLKTPRNGSHWTGANRRNARRLRWVCSLLLLCVVAPAAALAQDEPESTEPFFSVSSRQTYAPSQQPSVSIEFRQVDSLDFRIYRVNDPVQFFAKLKDAHSFGSIKQELAREKTLLERFHDWKRDLRFEIRDFLRSQVRWETRNQYHMA